MTSSEREDGAWFAPKRFGIGAAIPITWQGWLTLLAAIAIVVGAGLVFHDAPLVQLSIAVPVIVLLMIIAAKKTRGGWHWRWGKED